MTWNYRVMKFDDPTTEQWLEIREVYYDEAGKPNGYTEGSVGVVGETISELRDVLRLIEKALDKPILTPLDCGESNSQ